jgi:hypothetical protein
MASLPIQKSRVRELWVIAYSHVNDPSAPQSNPRTPRTFSGIFRDGLRMCFSVSGLMQQNSEPKGSVLKGVLGSGLRGKPSKCSENPDHFELFLRWMCRKLSLVKSTDLHRASLMGRLIPGDPRDLSTTLAERVSFYHQLLQDAGKNPPDVVANLPYPLAIELSDIQQQYFITQAERRSYRTVRNEAIRPGGQGPPPFTAPGHGALRNCR